VKNLGHIRVALWRVPPFRGAATGRPHHQSLGAQARSVIDAIVSIKTFGNATLREKVFCGSFFVHPNKADGNFEPFKMNSVCIFPKIDFMRTPSETYANFPFSSFPLIRDRAILGESFAASCGEVYLTDEVCPAAERPSPLGRGPTGRTPHC